MRFWKAAAVASIAIAFSVTAQAECGATHARTASNEAATGKVTTNGIARNELAANKLAVNTPKTSEPGAGAASDIVTVAPANGERFSR